MSITGSPTPAPNNQLLEAMKLKSLLLLLALCYLPVALATYSTPTQKKLKSNHDNEEGFAGPGSTVRQLEEDPITVISLRLRLSL
jgi:hypothetical protein